MAPMSTSYNNNNNNNIMTIRELQQELLELYETLDQRDQRIVELEETFQRHRDEQHSLGSKKMEIERLMSDVERYRNESVRARETIADWQARMALSTEDNKGLREDKNQLEQQVDSQKSLLNRQQQQILQHTKALEDSSTNLTKLSQEQYQLELYNQKLHHSIMELEENEQELVCEIEKLLQERRFIQAAHGDLNDKVKDLLVQLEAQCNQNQTLDSKNQELILKCDALQQSEIELQRKHEGEREYYKNQLSRLEMDLISSGQRISSLEVENNNLRSTTQCAKLEREVAQLKDDLRRLQTVHDTLQSDKSQLEGDLDGSCDALQAMQQQHEQDLVNAIARERARWIRLESSSDVLAKSERAAQERILDLQEQNDDLQQNLQKARERILMYEKENALEETSRYQKVLEADLCRREEDLRTTQNQLCQEMERSKALQRLCDRLVERFKASGAVLGSDDDDEQANIVESISMYESPLEKQNEYLMKRVTELEADRLRLMGQIRNENTRQFYSQQKTPTEISKVSEENHKKPGNFDENHVSSSDVSRANAELSAMKRGIEVLRSEFLDLQNKCADILLPSSSATDTESDISAEIAQTDFMTPYIRERIEQLLSEKISSIQSNVESEISQRVELHDKQLHDIIKNLPGDKDKPNHMNSPLCSSEPKVVPDASKQQKRKAENIGRLVRALAMCLKLIDGHERDLRERDLSIKLYEESLMTSTQKFALLYDSNCKAVEDAKKMEEELQQQIEQLLQEKEKDSIQIFQLGKSYKDAQERAESSNSDLCRMKESVEGYKSRCEELGHELEQHRKFVDEFMAQQHSHTSEDRTTTDVSHTSGKLARPNFYQLLSEKDRFIEKLQTKLKESRALLRSRECSKAEEMMKNIQLEHSEAVIMLQQIKSGFFSRSSENDQLTTLQRQLNTTQQEKQFIEAKYAASVDEIDRMRREMLTISSNMMEMRGKFETGENQNSHLKTLKTQNLEIRRLKSLVRSLQKTSAAKNAATISLEAKQVLEQKVKSLTDNLDKTSKSLLDYKRSKAKSDELLHEVTQRLQNAQDELAKKEAQETKLRQNLAEALSVKINALEKARKAINKLRALQKRGLKESSSAEQIEKQGQEIHE